MVDALKTTFSVHITLLSAAVFQLVVVIILSVEKFFVSPDEGGILNVRFFWFTQTSLEKSISTQFFDVGVVSLFSRHQQH